MKIKFVILLALFCAGVKPAAAQYCGVRSNLLALAAGTLNAGLEIMVAPHYSSAASDVYKRQIPCGDIACR